MSAADFTEGIVELYYQGRIPDEIAERFGVSPCSVRHVLRKEGVWKRTYQGKTGIRTEEVIRRPLVLLPGFEYEVSGVRLRLERVLRCAGGPMFLFRHRAGWRESFIQPQLKEAIIKCL